MFSLPDFSVKRPVCVFICLASLVIFGVSSVFSMPMESTPEMTSTGQSSAGIAPSKSSSR